MLRRTRSRPLVLSALLAQLAGCGGDGGPSATTGTGTGGGTTTSSTGGQPNVGTVDDIMSSLPVSCAFACDACPEPDTAFSCPTLQPWSALPHAAACGPWDGTFRRTGVTTSICTAPCCSWRHPG